MNKIAILTCSPKTDNSIDAHMRNAIRLREILQCDLITKKQDIVHNKYDLIIVSYASFYMDVELINFVKNSQARIGWITNEYNLSPNGSLYKAFSERSDAFIISNYNKGHPKVFKEKHIINLNVLLMNNKKTVTRKKRDLIYYGTYREDREFYFNKYMREGIIVSTSPKNIKKYLSSDIIRKNKPLFMGKMDWKKGKETLSIFEKSLYIEDKKTHDNYNFLANRFYEALMCDVMPIFDRSCLNTIRLSNYKITEGIVNSFDEIKKIKFNKKYIDNLFDDALKEKQKVEKNLVDLIYSL